ncbi:DUF397 domain-containing protein [Amycolatopsis sp. H20-H5]|uniref:DUF397 domain-containing protein n=1 Tax=Amycolatopsis sp. H20-H5 TaxID=3046309 RepID=UPI002DBDFB9A|nr:DUF397 domain-containing protein [Amycolatopsis sp. H20-H5]MEC3979429.1 DUF397 domain-containing protein [Amycolatopsis sp. H20-H5]
MTSLSPGPWFKSSKSTETQDCVEVKLGAVVAVRDTKDRHSGVLAVDGCGWSAFLGAVKREG